MYILAAIIIGLIVGVVAKFIMPGRDPGGFIITILIGIVGSIVATFVGQSIGLYQYGEPAGFLASVLGAMLLLLIFRLAMGKKV